MLLLSYSLIGGTGLAAAYTAGSSALGRYFSTPQKLALANGIASAGAGTGTVVLSIVVQHVAQHMGWRSAMQLLGAVFGVGLMGAGLLMVPVRKRKGAGSVGTIPAPSDATTSDSVTRAVSKPPAGEPGPAFAGGGEGGDLSLIIGTQRSLRDHVDTNFLNAVAAGEGGRIACAPVPLTRPPSCLDVLEAGKPHPAPRPPVPPVPIARRTTLGAADDAGVSVAIGVRSSPALPPGPRRSRAGTLTHHGACTPITPFMMPGVAASAVGVIPPLMLSDKGIDRLASLRMRSTAAHTPSSLGGAGGGTVRQRSAPGGGRGTPTLSPVATPQVGQLSMSGGTANPVAPASSPTVKVDVGVQVDDVVDSAPAGGAGVEEEEPQSVPETGMRGFLWKFGCRRLARMPASDTTVWSSPSFWATALSMAGVVSALCCMETHIVAYAALDVQTGSAFAASLVMIMGGASMAGRFLLGWVNVKAPHIPPLLVFEVFVIITGFALLGLPAYGSHHGYLVMFAALVGATGQNTYGQIAPALADLFGLDMLPLALGATYTVRAPFVLAAAPIAGWARERTGSYDAVWLATGVLMLASAVPMLAVRAMRHLVCMPKPPAEEEATPTRTA